MTIYIPPLFTPVEQLSHAAIASAVGYRKTYTALFYVRSDGLHRMTYFDAGNANGAGWCALNDGAMHPDQVRQLTGLPLQ